MNESLENAPETEKNASQEELEICVSCLGRNKPGSHFCGHCAAPLTSYAATAPFERAFAFGDFIRKATQKGRWRRSVRICVLGFAFMIIFTLLLGVMLP